MSKLKIAMQISASLIFILASVLIGIYEPISQKLSLNVIYGSFVMFIVSGILLLMFAVVGMAFESIKDGS